MPKGRYQAKHDGTSEGSAFAVAVMRDVREANLWVRDRMAAGARTIDEVCILTDAEPFLVAGDAVGVYRIVRAYLSECA